MRTTFPSFEGVARGLIAGADRALKCRCGECDLGRRQLGSRGASLKGFFRALLLLALVAAGPVVVRADTAAGGTAPGSYQSWRGRINEVVIQQPFKADNYRDILVEPLGTVGVQVPEKARQEEADRALKSAKAAFMEGLRGHLRERGTNRSSQRNAAQDALVIRARLVAIDPGSENARYYLFGLGGGAVSVSIAGEIFERSSHRTLVTFRQTRRSSFGSGGGTGFGRLFSKTTRQIGGDVAALINAF